MWQQQQSSSSELSRKSGQTTDGRNVVTDIGEVNWKQPQQQQQQQQQEQQQQRQQARKSTTNLSGEEEDDDGDDDGDEKKERESGRIDSGFLSGGNLQVSSELSCWEYDHGDNRSPSSVPSPFDDDAAAAAIEPMRADSGVDVGLSKSLSQLTLKQVTLNPLASGKVQAEPTTELIPVAAEAPAALILTQHHQGEEEFYRGNDYGYDYVDDGGVRANLEIRLKEEPWQLYYTQDDDGDTQLHIAIVQGFLEAAFSLIKMAPHPCLLNMPNDDGQSPLHLAVLTRQARIVRRLILAGANPSSRNFRGNTALHLACATGDLACAKALTDPLSQVERNYILPNKKIPALPQNLEQRNYDGEMCLHIAASGGHVDLVRLLLRLGADLEAREGLSGKTALHLAVERGCRSVVAFLLQECRPCLDTPTYAGTTAYQIALCFDCQLARELVRLGATPQPLPEAESDESDDEESSSSKSGAGYLPVMTRLRQNVVGVRV